MLERVPFAEIPASRYAQFVEAPVLNELRLAAGDLAGARVLHVTTARWGPDAERTALRVGMAQGLGLAADWAVVSLDASGARAARALRARLCGLDAVFDRDERATWLENLSREAARFEEEYDVVFVHGPEAAGILSLRGPTRARWFWVPDVDLSRPRPDAWTFLRPLLRDYDSVLVAAESFAPGDISHERLTVVSPAIEPLALRNVELGRAAVDAAQAMGIVPSRPLVVQRAQYVGDAHETLTAWRMVRGRHRDLQLALVMVADPGDPERAAGLTDIRAACADDTHVHVLSTDEGCGELELNALQRVAKVVVHSSDDEAFGLTAADAMWKGTPVLAAAKGGLPLLTADHAGLAWTGADELAAGMAALVDDPGRAHVVGAAGRERIRRYFLSPRLLLGELGLVRRALGRPQVGRTAGRVDPVCGMAMTNGARLAEATFDGHTYAFCSQRCRQRFEQEPTRWLRRPLVAGG